MGWLIPVQALNSPYRQQYATVANSYDPAKILVAGINETVRLEKILTDGEVKRFAFSLTKENAAISDNRLGGLKAI